MELAVSDDLVQFLHALRLHVHNIVDLRAVIHVPKVHSKIIGGEEVLSIGA